MHNYLPAGSIGSRLPVGGNDKCGCATVICGKREQRAVSAATRSHVEGNFVFLDFSFPLFHFPSSLLPARPCGHSPFSFFLFPSSSYRLSFHRSTQAIAKGRRLFSWSRPSISLVYFLSPPAAPVTLLLPPTHLTMRHRIPHLWIFLAFAWSCLLVGLASAAPAPFGSSSTETLYRRQENGTTITQPVVTQTVQTIDTFVHSLFDGSSLCAG